MTAIELNKLLRYLSYSHAKLLNSNDAISERVGIADLGAIVAALEELQDYKTVYGENPRVKVTRP